MCLREKGQREESKCVPLIEREKILSVNILLELYFFLGEKNSLMRENNPLVKTKRIFCVSCFASVISGQLIVFQITILQCS